MPIPAFDNVIPHAYSRGPAADRPNECAAGSKPSLHSRESRFGAHTDTAALAATAPSCLAGRCMTEVPPVQGEEHRPGDAHEGRGECTECQQHPRGQGEVDRIVQQPKRKPSATNVEREMPAWFPTRMKARSTRAERLTNGSRTSRGPSRRTVMHPKQKSSTTMSGARKLGPLVASAATASGSIATASRIRWKVSAAYRYPTEPSI
jgi:hypothetical protein